MPWGEVRMWRRLIPVPVADYQECLLGIPHHRLHPPSSLVGADKLWFLADLLAPAMLRRYFPAAEILRHTRNPAIRGQRRPVPAVRLCRSHFAAFAPVARLLRKPAMLNSSTVAISDLTHQYYETRNALSCREYVRLPTTTQNHARFSNTCSRAPSLTGPG